MGMLNNNTYVVINTGAQDLADKFQKKEFMAAFQICLTVFGMMVRILNSRYLLKFRHLVKVIWVTIGWFIAFWIYYFSYMLVGKNDWLGFGISLFATIVIGSFTSVGSSTIIGFMKAIPADSIAGYSSGTGIAGISGAGTYLLFSTLKLEFNEIVLILMPMCLLYFLNFKAILNLKARLDLKITHAEDKLREGEESKSLQEKIENGEAKVNLVLSVETIKNVLKLLGMPIYNMAMVYFLEYSCTTSFAERAHPKSSQVGDFWHRKAFVLLSLSYQLGVFISRSTFYLFKVRKVWILTYLQMVNFVIFFTIAYWKWIEIYYQIPLMIWVGLMGGCSYVNCMFMILENKDLSKSQKEVAINVASFFDDLGVVSAAFFALFISNFVIRND